MYTVNTEFECTWPKTGMIIMIIIMVIILLLLLLLTLITITLIIIKMAIKIKHSNNSNDNNNNIFCNINYILWTYYGWVRRIILVLVWVLNILLVI